LWDPAVLRTFYVIIIVFYKTTCTYLLDTLQLIAVVGLVPVVVVFLIVNFYRAFYATPLIRYVIRCTTERLVFSADLKPSILRVGPKENPVVTSFRSSDERERTPANQTRCDHVAARTAHDEYNVSLHYTYWVFQRRN